MCRFFDVSRSGYYSFRKRSKQSNRESLLVGQIQACRDSGKYMYTYGCRRVQLWIERQYGKHYNYKTIWRVMHKYGLPAKIRHERFVHCGEETRTYANLLNRNFHADRPNQKWVTDISYIPTRQGTLYLSIIRDLFDLSIVAYKTSTRQSIKLVLDTVRLAMEKEEVTAELQLHSDQGFPYASQSCFALTKEYGITPSMSRRANPYDNAMAENFFSISNPNAFVFTNQRPSMKHRLSLMNIPLFTTTTAFSLTPGSLLSKNDACLRNPSLSCLWWFYFCPFFLEQFISRWL